MECNLREVKRKYLYEYKNMGGVKEAIIIMYCGIKSKTLGHIFCEVKIDCFLLPYLCQCFFKPV